MLLLNLRLLCIWVLAVEVIELDEKLRRLLFVAVTTFGLFEEIVGVIA